MKKLADRVAVITGAGSGIGRATSIALAEKGCRLALADVDAGGLAETERLVRALGRAATSHEVDVSDKTRMQAFAREVEAAHGGAHILINNAGVGAYASLLEHELHDFEWLMGVNFWGVVYGCKFFLPQLCARDRAQIVNVSSIFGLIGFPAQTSYCASKYAVRGFSEALRLELRNTQVGVTAVYPGGVATNIAAQMRVGEAPAARRAKQRSTENLAKMLPPAAAAAAIVHGIERNKPRVLIAPETYLADFATRLAPAGTLEAMAWGYEWYRANHLS